MTFYEVWRQVLVFLGCIAFGRGTAGVLWWAVSRYSHKKSAKDTDIIPVRVLQPAHCRGCDNVFFVRGTTAEFYPSYCCYCGARVRFRKLADV